MHALRSKEHFHFNKEKNYIALNEWSMKHNLIEMAISTGIAAATMFTCDSENELSDTQLRVAFDGDAVLFSDESEIIVKEHGLDTFFKHEKEFENKPLAQVN